MAAMPSRGTTPISGTRGGGGGNSMGGGGERGSQGPTEVEAQVAELQRRYRLMEGTRKSYTEDSQNVIRRQRSAIEKLKEDNVALRQELALEQGADVMPSLSVQQEIAKLQDLADSYTRKIDLARRQSEDLEKQASVLQAQLLEKKKNMGGANAGKETNQQIQKQIKVLENRLDKALIKFNESLSHNKELRDTIDNLRRERSAFDSIYRKLERELHDRKREMAAVIEVSNIAYEARDQAQNEIAALKAQADREQAQFEAEMRELNRQLEEDRRRVMMNRVERERQLNHEEEEARMRRKTVKSAMVNRDATPGAEEKVQSYEEAFAKIQAATGITDIDELVTTFIQAEDQNFSLFNYVNDLNQEMEKLEEQVAEIKEEIERYAGAGASSDTTRKGVIRELEAKLQRTEAKSEMYEVKYNGTLRIVNNLKAAIASMFHKTGCSVESIRDQIVGGEGVTENNMMQYLGYIEQRTNEILAMYNATQRHRALARSGSAGVVGAAGAAGQSTGGEAAGGGSSTQRSASAGGNAGGFANGDAGADAGPSAHAVHGHGPSVPAGATNISIEPPSTADEYISDDDSEEEVDDRPLTRDELQAKTLRMITKRGESSIRGKGRRSIKK
eukprot:jgi/Mesvir1/24403/Mv11071-RA.1